MPSHLPSNPGAFLCLLPSCFAHFLKLKLDKHGLTVTRKANYHDQFNHSKSIENIDSYTKASIFNRIELYGPVLRLSKSCSCSARSFLSGVLCSAMNVILNSNTAIQAFSRSSRNKSLFNSRHNVSQHFLSCVSGASASQYHLRRPNPSHRKACCYPDYSPKCLDRYCYRLSRI